MPGLLVQVDALGPARPQIPRFFALQACNMQDLGKPGIGLAAFQFMAAGRIHNYNNFHGIHLEHPKKHHAGEGIVRMGTIKAASAPMLSDYGKNNRHLLNIAAVQVSDAFALCFAGHLGPDMLLRIARAVAASPASQTAYGRFVLLVPLMDGLQQLQASLPILMFVIQYHPFKNTHHQQLHCASLHLRSLF